MKARLYNGDSYKILTSLIKKGKLVDAIVTDPPYGINFMAKGWDRADNIAFNPKFWRKCYKVLKPGGHLVAFSATRTYHHMAVAIEQAGFEIRDQLMWIYGQGFPKSLDISKQMKSKKAKRWEGWGTALKPSWEPICFARKPLSEKTVARNVIKHGTGAINIDENRIGKSGGTKSVGDPNYKNQVYGKGMGGLGIDKNSKQGRWPANILHDGSEAVVSQFPESNSSRIGNSNNPKHGKGHKKTSYGWGYERESIDHRDSGSAARFFYIPKSSTRERNWGLRHRNNIHPTVKPIKLMSHLCKLVTPKRATILDPFLGSGTTGIAAVKSKFKFIGIEREKKYYKIARKRIRHASRKKKSDKGLFSSKLLKELK